VAHLEDRGPLSNRLRWRVRWRDPSGKHRSKSFARRADAVRYMHGLATDLYANTYTDPNAGRVIVDDLAREWLARKDVLRKPKTAHGYRQVYRTMVQPRWGGVPVGTITARAVQTWITELAARYSPSRVRQAHLVLAAILDDTDMPNPARARIERPPMPMRATYPLLTHGQVAALADAAGDIGTPMDRALVLVMAYTGLRWSELVALTWADWDELGRRLWVRRAEPDVNGRLIPGTPKSRQARGVPVAAPAALSLATLDRTTPRMFQAPSGAPIRAGRWRARVLTPACHRTGLPVMTPHAFRHTAASLAIASGASVKAVQAMLGHSRASYTMTLDVYADLPDGDLDALAERMADAAEAAPPWTPPPRIAER
jgi:integrase